MPTPWDKSLPTGVRRRNIVIIAGAILITLCCLCALVLSLGQTLSPEGQATATIRPMPTATRAAVPTPLPTSFPTATSLPIATAAPSTTPLPVATPKPAATVGPPTPTSKPILPGVYYLWYKSDPGVKVAIIGFSHGSGPVDTNQLVNWVLAGTACVAPAGTRAYRGSGNAPMFTVAVEVADGNCRGFTGWVPLEAWQQTQP